jgi:hypothetical protein
MAMTSRDSTSVVKFDGLDEDEHLERTGEDQISLTDPDSRAMASHTHVAVAITFRSQSIPSTIPSTS